MNGEAVLGGGGIGRSSIGGEAMNGGAVLGGVNGGAVLGGGGAVLGGTVPATLHCNHNCHVCPNHRY